MRVVVAKSERDPRWLARNRRSYAKRVSPVAKVSDADQAEIDRLLSNQTSVTAQIRSAFLQAIDQLGNQIDIEQIRSLLEQGRVDQALAMVNAQLVGRGMSPVAQAASAGAIYAGQQAALGLGELNVSFGVTNPATIDYLRTYEMGLIRGLTQDALASVRLVVQNGILAGRNPLDIARDIRAFIGLTPTQTQAVLNYRAGLDSLDSSVLDRALRDARFDPTVETAIANDTPLSSDYIDKLVARYQQRYLNYRADTIARTEAIRAVNAGNHQLWKQAANDGKIDGDQVTRKWVYTHDNKTRPAHRAIPRLNPDGVGLDEPFDTPLGPLLYPGDPNGVPENTINCRCTVVMRYTPAAEQDAAA